MQSNNIIILGSHFKNLISLLGLNTVYSIDDSAVATFGGGGGSLYTDAYINSCLWVSDVSVYTGILTHSWSVVTKLQPNLNGVNTIHAALQNRLCKRWALRSHQSAEKTWSCWLTAAAAFCIIRCNVSARFRAASNRPYANRMHTKPILPTALLFTSCRNHYTGWLTNVTPLPNCQ